jgi:hypothetical protein
MWTEGVTAATAFCSCFVSGPYCLAFLSEKKVFVLEYDRNKGDNNCVEAMLCRESCSSQKKWLAAWGQHGSAISTYEGRHNSLEAKRGRLISGVPTSQSPSAENWKLEGS